MQEQINTLEDFLRSDDEGPPSILEYGTTPALESVSQFLNDLRPRTQIREIAQEEARRICAPKTDNSFLKAAEDELSDAFQIGFESENNERNDESFLSVPWRAC